MGSLLPSVIANFYMEDYKMPALPSAPLKPHCWFPYIGNIFTMHLTN
jgi:hypothetical protein